jgi:hypothetical protein
MKNRIFLLLILFSVTVRAQKTYTINPAKTVTFTAALNDITIHDIFMVNTGSGSIALTWEKISINVPSQWGYSMCDLGACYPGIPAGAHTMSTVSQGSTGFLGLNIDPGSTSGTGQVKVRVYQNGFESSADTLTWHINTSIAGIHEVSLSNKIKIYPQPASDFIQLQLQPGVEVKDICLYDISGKKVQSLNLSAEKISISDLERGMYVLSIATKQGRAIKRIVKE